MRLSRTIFLPVLFVFFGTRPFPPAGSMLVGGNTPADAEERYATQKVVYHINYTGGDSDKKYLGAMRNIQNHINAVGAENMEIKVVLHGNGRGAENMAASPRPPCFNGG